MDLSEQERSLIDKKIKKYRCPFCGGQIVHLIQPFILLCLEGEDVLDGHGVIKTHPHKYLVGECQNCGYTVLRRLDILLGFGKGTALERTPNEYKQPEDPNIASNGE